MDELPPGAEILDFGCGTGEIARHMRGRGCRVTGLDISAEMIALCRRTHTIEGLSFERYMGHGPLPLPDAAFDAIVSSSVLEYVTELDALLLEMRRVIRPGGLLRATVPDPRDPVRRREAVMIRALSLPGMARLAELTRWHEGAGYLRLSVNRFDPEEWNRRLNEAEFKPEPVQFEGPLMMLRATALR